MFPHVSATNNRARGAPDTVSTPRGAVPATLTWQMTRRTGPLDPVSGWYLAHVRGRHTNDRFALTEVSAPAGDMAPLHVHRRDDETCYVLDGELTLHVGDDVVTAGPGVCVHAPRNVPHTYEVTSAGPARWLIVSSPAGSESLIERMGAMSPERLFVDHGIELLERPQPLPGDPGA
jgi:quercetin dioxygenase-like cupin family protein